MSEQTDWAAEREDVLARFREELVKATGDGSKKRQSGEKPPWYRDGSHWPALYRHLAAWENEEGPDPDSRASALVHLAWRALAIACIETGNTPLGEPYAGIDRVCAACGDNKPIAEFGRGPKTQAFNRHSHCRTCHNSRVRDKRRGIGEGEYDSLLKQQGGRCAICMRKKKRRERAFAVDHDHETGATRGILCVHCNVGLGMFNDNVTVLKEAIRYLEAHDEPTMPRGQ